MSDPGSSFSRAFDELQPEAGSEAMPAADDPADEPGSPPGNDDLTVISNGPPLLLPKIHHGMHPSALGKSLEGERLGYFQLEEFIGGGGMGAVFRAVDTMLNRTVAVKVLSSEPSDDEETERRFKNEAQSAARLDHENIARVYYVGEDLGVQYIVFEYIDGINLRDLVDRRGPLPLGVVVSYTLQIADALAHAAQRDVVHRDIKPSNVLITREGRAKLVDMGLARLHQVEHSQQDLTASGVTLGTFDYISPEQARDPRTADVRSDLYSLGCTMFFMFTGRPPFPEGTVLQKLLQHQGDAPPDPRDMRPDLPQEICRIVAKLLAKSPDKRHQQPADLVADLYSVAEQFGLGVVAPGGSVPLASDDVVGGPFAGASSAVRRHLPWLVPAVLLLAVVGALDRVWSTGPGTFELPEIRPLTIAAKQATAGDNPSAVRPQPPESNDATTTAGPLSTGTGFPTATAKTSPGQSSDASEPTAVVSAVNPLALRLARATAGASMDEQVFPAAVLDAGRFAFGLAAGGSAPGTSHGVSVGNVAAGEPNAAQSGPAIDTNPMDVLVVSPGRDDGYASLGAACRAAQSGDVIELRYNGPLVEKPIILANMRLTIRAGENYRPQVVFRPGPDEIDPVKYPRSMLTVAAGELTLLGAKLELDMPRALWSDSWCLIEVRDADQVRLADCTLTIRNTAEGQAAYHEGVAFFEVKAPLGRGTMMSENAGRGRRPAEIRLERCVARGEANFLRVGQMQPVHLDWEDGLLAVSERLLLVQSDRVAGHDGGEVEADLRHLTIVAQQGMLLATNSDDAPYLSNVKIKCSDSIVMGGPQSVLIEQRGIDRPETFQDALLWSGDRNFYEGFHGFWKIESEGSDEEPEPMELAEWQQYWELRPVGGEYLPRQGAVYWRNLPSADRPLHAHTVADYLLTERSSLNPARGAAHDGRDAGFRAERLATSGGEPPAAIPGPPEPPEETAGAN